MLINTIKSFLVTDSEVIVPGFGGFYLVTKEMRFDEVSGSFIPPLKEVVFVESDRNASSSFYSKMEDTHGFSESQVKSLIDGLVSQLRVEITENGRFELEGLGVFTVDDTYSLQFKGISWLEETSDFVEEEFSFPIIERDPIDGQAESTNSIEEPTITLAEDSLQTEATESELPDFKEIDIKELLTASDIANNVDSFSTQSDLQNQSEEVEENTPLFVDISSESENESDTSQSEEKDNSVPHAHHSEALKEEFTSNTTLVGHSEPSHPDSNSQNSSIEDEPRKLSVGKILVIILVPIVACLLAFTYIKKYSPNRNTEILSQSERGSDIPPVSKLPEVAPPAVPIDEEPLKETLEVQPATQSKEPETQKVEPEKTTENQEVKKVKGDGKTDQSKKSNATPALPKKEDVLPAPKASKGGSYMISVGSFGVEANATKLAAELKQKGFEVKVIPPANSKKLYKVGIGSFGTSSEAKEYLKKIQPDFKENLFIMK